MHTLAGMSATKTLEAVRKWTNQNPMYLLGSIINQLERERRGLGLHSASTHYYYYKLLMI
jgi:hypothetical protein